MSNKFKWEIIIGALLIAAAIVYSPIALHEHQFEKCRKFSYPDTAYEKIRADNFCNLMVITKQ